MNALISPNEQVFYISGWNNEKPQQPIYTQVENAQRVAEICESTFEVAPPLFWMECSTNIVADAWYFDSVEQEFFEVPSPAPKPQPIVVGAKTL
jgi:hypothetical protein